MSKYKLNNKGFYISFTVMSLFILTIFLIFLVVPQLTRMVSASKDSKLLLDDVYNQRNIDERISATFVTNPSYEGVISFETGYDDVVVAEVESNYINVTTSSNQFEVKNATNLNIHLNVDLLDPYIDWYQAKLTYNGVDVAIFNGDDLFLPSDYFYDKDTNITKYGDYRIVVTKSSGASVSHISSYNVLTERIVEISDNAKNRNIYFNFEE